MFGRRGLRHQTKNTELKFEIGLIAASDELAGTASNRARVCSEFFKII